MYEKWQLWYAYINVDGLRIRLGHFKRKQDAVQARREAELTHYGEYRRTA